MLAMSDESIEKVIPVFDNATKAIERMIWMGEGK